MSSSSIISQPNGHNSVGIDDFFRDKTIFVTGSTGFLGKVFVEKLLREVPTVRKVYLLMRANNEEAEMQRLKTEITDSKLFKVLRQKHGESYEEFVLNKLVSVTGDLCKPNLGMDIELGRVVRNEVDVIVHMGAKTTWIDRHDVSFEMNVRAVSRLVDFAKDCLKLVLYVHVSTDYLTVCCGSIAYATQNIPGVTFESLVDFGQYYRNEDGQNSELQIVDQLINDEMRIISEVALRFPKEEQGAEMIKLGIRRSKDFRMTHNYQLTKAMGEMVATKLSGRVPVVILRPSLIESTFKEPFPGWIEGYKVLEPLILGHGTGQLGEFVADACATLNVVPVDMVVNAMMAAIAKHGKEGKHGVNIYNLAPTLTNPLSCQELFDFSTEYFTVNPLNDSNGNAIRVKNMKFMESLSEYTLAGTSSNAGLRSKFLRWAALYEPILTLRHRYDDKNTMKLFREMSLAEQNMYDFNLKSIDWKNYFVNIHIPGVIQHVLKKKDMTAKL